MLARRMGRVGGVWACLLAAVLLPHCSDPGEGEPGGEAGAAGDPGGGNAGRAGGGSAGGGNSGQAGTHQQGGTEQGGSEQGGASNVAGDGGSAGSSGEPPSEGGQGAAGGSIGGEAGEGGASVQGGTANGGDGGSPIDTAGTAGEGSGGSEQLLCKPPGEYCRTYSDCPFYEGCVDERCVPIAEGQPCSTALDCGKAQYCDEFECKKRKIFAPLEECLPSGGTPGICPEGSQCYWFGPHGTAEHQCVDGSQNTGFCDNGLIPCAAAYYCPAWVDEFSPPPVCIAKAGVGASCTNEEPSSCLPGLSCNFYKCQAELAPVATQCDPTVSAWNSPLLREYDPRYPAACAVGAYCRNTGEDGPVGLPLGECTALLPLGADCNYQFECQQGYCSAAGKCTAPTLASECGYGQTAAGKYAPVCPADAGCYDGKCRAYLALGDQCNQGRPCPLGSVCHQAAPAADYYCVDSATLDEGCETSVCIDQTFCVNATP